MREIKFRAWDKEDKDWLEELYIDLWGNPYGFINNYYPRELEPIHSEIILMQYTGLKDSKGVDVYEGDIISHPTSKPFQRTVVKFNEKEGNFSCWSETEKDWVPRDYINITGNREVIGNIYENKELLK